jgi:hypothetical protein
MVVMYRYCHIEQMSNGLWYIMYPDNTKACPTGYKTSGWATRTLNRLLR